MTAEEAMLCKYAARRGFTPDEFWAFPLAVCAWVDAVDYTYRYLSRPDPG
jgi:hypothetical protein